MGSRHQQDEDVTTFEGFGSFVQSFTPQSAPPYDSHDHGQNNHHDENVHELGGHDHTFHELDSGTTTQKQPYVAELPHEQHHYVAELPHEQHHHYVAELPATQWEKPNPYPEPRKIPVPAPEPQKITIPTPASHPAPIYDDGPEVVVHKSYIPPYDPTPQPIYKPKSLPPVEPRPVKRKPPEVQKIVIREVPDPITRIEVRGLQKTGQKGVFTEVLNLSAYSFLDDVAREVTKLGYKPPLGFAADKNNAEPLSIQTGTSAESFWNVLLTTGKSCYDPDVGLRMHVDEPFSNFMAKLQISVKCTDDLISINDGDLKIAFHRTLRVPEDGRVHKLPASFGRFPIKNVVAYQKKLLNSQNASLLDMAKKGGIFFPVFQREAMWISFSASADSEYKIRVFVGGVNVVTGKKWDDQTKNKSAYDKEDQDYVLVPPQKHLDGIAVGNGIVQQFIAMPVGSGYSIEKQITGREDIGGVQLEVTPQKRLLSFFHHGREVDNNNSNESDIITTPRKGGMNPGDMIRMTRSRSHNTSPFFGGKKREKQKRTLHELMTGSNPHGPMPLHVGMHALYPISLSIKIPGTLTKHKITTPPFSPLDTIQTVLKKTKHKGKDLSFFKVSHDKILQDWETIIGAGLYDGAVLTAHKETKGGGSRLSAQAPAKMAVGPGRYSSPPTYGGPSQQPVSYNSYSSPAHQGVSPGGPPMAAQRLSTNIQSAYNPNTDSNEPVCYQSLPQNLYAGPVSPTYAALPSTAAPPSQYASMSHGSPVSPASSYATPAYYGASPTQTTAPPPQAAPMAYGSPVSPTSSYTTPASYGMPPIQTAGLPQSAAPASYSSPVSPIAPASYAIESSYNSAAAEHDLTSLGATAYEEEPVGAAAPGHYDDALAQSSASPSQYNAPPGRLAASPDYTAPSAPMQPARLPAGSAPLPMGAAPLPMGAAASPMAAPQMQSSPSPMQPTYSPANYDSLPPRQQQQQQQYQPQQQQQQYQPQQQQQQQQQYQPQYQQYQPHQQQHQKPKPKPPPTESWAMSLAAGGRLSQQIHLDTTPSQYRSPSSPAATALINIQLLNALAYETLTGMLCPPTPITPKQYADAGIPWYSSYEPHASSVSGGAAFASLRSVGQIDAEAPIYADTSLAGSGGMKVACTVCRRNLCDCVLRPCNHAFCAACVRERMVHAVPGRRERVTRCAVCQGVAEKLLGFSAPMALPGLEEWIEDVGMDVAVKVGSFGRGVVFELE